MDFVPFPKMARLYRECVITEKIDGTNAQLLIGEDGSILAGSRNRWLSVDEDNFGFARWVSEHRDELLLLGPGRHYGEWWGCGIQRTYGLSEKRLSLFNVRRFSTSSEEGKSLLPPCVGLVPVLFSGIFDTDRVGEVLRDLRIGGSVAAPGFMNPEGIVVYHTAAGVAFKTTLVGDEKPKSAP